MKKLLSAVELTNLLQINWNEQKIQNNFKVIVDALSDQETSTRTFREDIEGLKEEIVFIKALIKEGGTHITNHNVNVTREESQGGSREKREESDPFKIREMLQKIQKEMKELGTKQSDTDMLLDKIQDVQERLQEDLKMGRQKLAPVEVINKGGDQDKKESKQKVEENIRIHSGKSKKGGEKEKEKEKEKEREKETERNQKNPVETSLKDLNISQPGKSGNSVRETSNGVNQENITEVIKSSKVINNQLSDLLEKIEELKSDNTRITAKLNSHDQALESLRKAPAPSKLRSADVKPQPKSEPEKAPSTKATGSDSEKNIRMEGEIQDVKDDLATLEDQINKYYLDANTLRLCYEEMKLWINDLKKADSKKESAINDINHKIVQIVENHKDDKDRIDQELKQLRTTLLKAALEEKREVKPETPSVLSSDRRVMQQFDENYKDKINDKLSKLQALLMQAATQSDLQRVRADLKQNIQEANTKIDHLKQTISDINKKLQQNQLDQQSQNSQIRKLQNDLSGLSGLVNDKFGATEKKGNITNSKIQEMKKNIQQVREDLEFYKQSFNKPSSSISNSGGQTGGDGGLAGYQGRNSGEFDKRKYDELKKEILNKLHDNKAELYSQLKDFERKFSNKNTFEQDIAILFDKIGEIKLFLGKKADADDTKKSIIYLEKKMSVALASLSNDDDNTEDARVAKKSWFCLSCDKVLQNYNGKVGKHIAWDGLGTTKFGTKTSVSDENKRPKELQPIKK